jgi:hypothetical protein
MKKVCIFVGSYYTVYHKARFKKRKKIQTLTTGDRTVLYKLHQTTLSTHNIKAVGHRISQVLRAGF